MTHFFDHHAGDGAAVPVGGRALKQIALLFDAGKFGVALIDDQVDQRIAHLLRGHLAQVFPLLRAFERAKLDLVGFDRAVKRVEFEVGNLVVIDADVLAPIVEQANPVTEGSDFCYFSWHNAPIL